MSDEFRLDSHKLIYHPDTVTRWVKGENIYPIELEVSLTNACNHRCIFCAVDYTGYQPVMLDKQVLLSNLRELSIKGVKSIIYAGEGEPLLHKAAPEIINMTKRFGIDAAMSTNGVLFSPEVAKECMESLTWIRFSVGGIHEDTYNKIHCGRNGDLQKVLANIQDAVSIKRERGLKTTFGVQLLLLPDNKDELVEMAKELKRIGIDYFTVKPFSQHPQSQQILQVDYREMLDYEKELKSMETDRYKIYFRAHAMEKLCLKRTYKHCYALPFMVYVDSKGNLWPCIVFMGENERKYGNLYENSFCEIWEGPQRENVRQVFQRMDLESNCREICRLDEMNRYLDELLHPGAHVNFI